MVEYSDLNEIWFVISPHNPLKEKQTLLENNHRLALVKVAIEGNKKFKVSDIEFKMPLPSYTINTLTYLEEKYPKKKFALIMGSDNLDTLDKWKNYQMILKKYEIYIYPRRHSQNRFIDQPNINQVNAPLMEISSSSIRKAIKEKKDVSYLVPEKVYEYIKEMHFYEKKY